MDNSRFTVSLSSQGSHLSTPRASIYVDARYYMHKQRLRWFQKDRRSSLHVTNDYKHLMVHQEKFHLSTSCHGDMHDITDQVNAIVKNSGIKTGMAHIFNIGSTAAVGTIEFEPGLQRDLPELLSKLIPPSRDYGHEQMWHDGNGHSHLQATWLGPSLTVPVQNGKLELGTWQQIFHLECDIKPRQRQVIITVYGE